MSDAVELFGPAIEEEARTIAALAEEIQGGWSHDADLRVNVKGWIYDLHPYLFTTAFPEVPRPALRRLALAGRFLANAVVLMDMQIDEPVDAATAAGWALRGTALQFEAYRLLQGLFPPTSEFWPAFRGSISDFITAYAMEQEFASGKRAWQTFGTTAGIVIATGKTAMAKGSVFGLAELAGETAPVAALARSIDEYNIARQIFDDVHDWKADLRDGRPSVVLREILPQELPGPKERTSPALLQDLARRLYYDDVLDTMMDRVLLHVGRALDEIAAWPDLPWRKAMRMLERGAHDLQADTRRITAENRARLRAAPDVAVTVPTATDRWQEVVLPGIAFLVDQWRSGFGEARALGYFSHSGGFTSDEYQSGDVFQRALITDALLDADPLLHGQLQPIIDSEAGYLLSRRSADGLGWSFYPRLPELPNDADDVAQVMQVLLRADRRADVVEHCERAIAVVLDGGHGDGSFETWIVPAPPPHDAIHDRQLEFIAKAWGTGPDPDVIANFLYALALYDRERFSDQIDRGVEWLSRRQSADGSWSSTWYEGPFYGIYVNARLLDRIGARSPLRRAEAFLRGSQRPDGGWSVVKDASDPLSTALATLALGFSGVVADDPALRRAREFIAASQAVDGGWRSVPFIKMDMERASNAAPRLIYYGSRTLTTAFVCKAGLAAASSQLEGRTLVAQR
ncbi:MAG TPA: prenyltransferase/squalene oxidase repeat-containing protein [Candidatus Bathyarchaeia archaeon]|nr:prenyltransferase/squalene oxidase repeat-containing protein [Candidatus Bathyarchaeia archaeon]